MPLAAVTGRAEIVDAPRLGGLGSTFGGNPVACAAALKSIEIMERENVLDNIWQKGDRFLNKVRNVIASYNVGAELSGVAPMFFITFRKDEGNTQRGRRDDFYTQMIRRGFFFAPHHHAYINYRHSEEDLDKTVQAIDESLAYVSEKYQDSMGRFTT